LQDQNASMTQNRMNSDVSRTRQGSTQGDGATIPEDKVMNNFVDHGEAPEPTEPLYFTPKRRSTAPAHSISRTNSTEIDEEGGSDKEAEEKNDEQIAAPAKKSIKQKPSALKKSSAHGRTNSPKPIKTSRLVTEEATESSLSHEEASRIVGMRILLAEGIVY
jgi:hypothetical protein